MSDELQPGPVQGPGYYDFTDAEYHADPAPRASGSSSVLAELLTGPALLAKESHPKLRTPPEKIETADGEEDAPEEDNKKFDLGSVAHELLLGKGAGIHVIDAKDWRKKAVREERAEAIANGNQPCLIAMFEKAQVMVAAARVQLGDDPDNCDAFTNGRGEVSLFWKEPTKPGKMWMRARLDWQMDDRRRVYDYKTFARGADPEKFNRWMVGAGKDIQDPFYSRGVAAIEGCDWEDITFRFVVQDTEFPYLLSVIELADERDLEKSQGGRRWSYERSQWAIDKWAACAATQIYRGFIPRTHQVSAPAWAQSEWERRRRLDEAGEMMLEEQGGKAVLA